MVGEDRLIAAGEGVYVLVPDARIEPSPRIEPWAYVIAGKRRTARHAGIGFTAPTIRACKGEGPLTLRHVQAGLRLIANAERRDTSHGLTMEWDSGPVDRERRGGPAGGRRGTAAYAAQRLQRVGALMNANVWTLVCGLCAWRRCRCAACASASRLVSGARARLWRRRWLMTARRLQPRRGCARSLRQGRSSVAASAHRRCRSP